MRLVSEQSEAEIALRQASSELTTHLRALTANLMRISRGAGAPHHLRYRPGYEAARHRPGLDRQLRWRAGCA